MDVRKYLPMAASIFLLVGPAHAQISFPGFNSSNVGPGSGQITVNGNTAVVAPALRLTPNDGFQYGSAFFNNPIKLNEGFSTSFDYTIADGFNPADGFAFLISNDPAGVNALGFGGGGLGFQALEKTLGITVDTYESPGNPEIGLHVKDSADVDYAFVPKGLSDIRGSHNLKIDFTNVASGVGDIKVSLDNIPTLNLLGFNLNPFLDGSGQAQVGFGSGTGLYYDRHDITLWALNSNAQPSTPWTPGPVTPTPTPEPPPNNPNSVPEPISLALVGLGGMLLAARRRH